MLKLSRKMKSVFRCVFGSCLVGLMGSLPGGVCAQISEKVYTSDYHILPEKERQLSVELDNISFFKNNEYDSQVMKGYSLPGLWLQPKAVYYPLKTIKLELGAHALIYHGAVKYPSMAYQDIAYWKGDQYQYGVHILPWFRAQAALSDQVNIVLGNIYGAANHQLIDPLYSPELNLTADPETGLQVLVDTRVLHLDSWVNWQSFIYRTDTHQEAFTFGLSSRVKFNDPESKWHFYLPFQALAQHRGGEIDTLTTNSVQTLMNGALGLGTVWNVNAGLLKRVSLEADVAGYYQQAGKLWPLDNGYGNYINLTADISNFRLKASYWECYDFISMFGSPFYGSVSTSKPGMTFDQPQMVYFGAEYARTFGKGFAIGIDVDVYYRLPCSVYDPTDGWQPAGAATTSFSAGIYLRANPSFLLKKF